MNSMFAAVRQLSLWLILSSLLGLAACGGGDGGGTPARSLSRIEVTPSAPSIAAGTQKQFTATAVYSDNTREDATSTVTWASSNTAAATITPAGLATGVRAGSSTIAATLGSVTGATTLTVTAATVTSLAVSPSTASIAKGTTQAYKATATFSDRSTQDVTAQSDWSSASTAIATVGNSGSSKGVATGTGIGNTTLTAVYSGQSANAAITVTAATLKSVTVTPKTASAAKGTTQQYAATAVFTDNSTQDVTAQATWTTSDSSTVSISDTAPTKGLATAQAVGSATLTGTYQGTSDTATLTVTAAQLVSIAVSPASPSVAKGLTQQFTATGTYTDSSTQDLTTMVTWSSSDTNTATISNASGSQGLAQAVGLGSATITASQPGGSITGTAALSVSAAVVTAVGVTPATPSVPKGLSQAFTAVATFSDNSTQDVTNAANWTSSDTTIATISNADGSHGVATTLAAGSTVINGAYMGYSGNATLTVTAATLTGIAVTPSQPSIAKGLSQQFQATGTYTDNSTQDLTSSVAWSSSDTTIATISNASGSQGLAQGVAVGSATITAASGSVSGTTTLTVTAAVVSAVNINPTAASIAKGTTQQFTATATFSDNTTQDVTSSSTFTSSDTTVATVDNASSHGLATGVAIGSTSITAAYSGFTSGAAALNVTAAVLKSIAVTPPNPSIANGLSQQFTATGVYSDNSTQDLTGTVTWSSGTTSVATISNANGSRGLAQSVAVGSSTITATDPSSSIAGTATLTVTAATLMRVDVSPTSPSTPVGLSQQFSALGVYTDSSKQDLTSSVTWSSSDTTIADISNGSSNKGLAVTKKVGSTTITATQSSVSGTASLTVTSATLQSIQVQPVNASLPQGYNLQMTATGRYSDSTTQDITKAVTWVSGTTSVATISNSASSQGVATGVSGGSGSGTSVTSQSTNISATLNGVTGGTTLNVNTATLTTISVTPSNQSIPLGYTQQYTATGTFSNQQTLDLTQQVSWSASDTTVITIDQTGLAKPVKAGTATIMANKGGTTGTNGTTPVTVTAAVLQSIQIAVATTTPAQACASNVSTANGTTCQFVATGYYSDKTSQTITTNVTWSSSDTTVATITNSSTTNSSAGGLATGKKVGTTNISAASGSVTSNTLQLNVTAATLSSIKIVTADGKSSYAKGKKVQLTATGTYSDSSTGDITKTVTWSSSTSNVSVSNASGTQGQLSADAVGMANVTAALSGVTSNTLAITVTAATPTSLAITPVNPSIQNGTSQQFTATLTYSDGTTADVTTSTTWTSGTTSVATISNASGSQGLATTIAPGSTTIGASNTTNSVTTTSSTTLTVLRGALQSIVVSPSSATVPAGYQQQFTAMGYYSDSTSQDITATVSWSTFNSSVATISNSSGSQGLMSAQAAGSTTVLASLSGKSGSASVTVSSETLSKIDVSPQNGTIATNATLQFTAKGTFSSGTTLDLTRQVVWKSSNTGAATIDQKGLATAGSSTTGTTNITAASGSVTGTSLLTKTP